MSHRLTKCDSEGVPLLLQSLEWYPGTMTFKSTLFDGSTSRHAGEMMCQQLGLAQSHPTQEQWADATVNVEKEIRYLMRHRSKLQSFAMSLKQQ